MTLPLFDTIKQLQEAYLMFPAFLAASEQIRNNLMLYRSTGVAQNLLVLGQSGTGKTTLSQMFAAQYPKQTLPERDVLPVLYVSVPAAATIAGTVEAVLAQLGDPQPERGTVSSKTSRAVKIAKGCGVEMLLFDEAQHIHDRGKTHSQYFVGDWLKSFMDALGLPVTLLGLPRTETLLQVNEQLRRRFTHRLSLSVHPQDKQTDEENSLVLFNSLAKALRLPIYPHPYSWRELGVRLYFATDGRISYVKQLLIGAYSQALDRSSTEISVPTLEAAFSTIIWPAGIGALNPFHKDFQFRSLDRLSEPFQAGDVASSAARRRGR
jgi:adenylate kinase family enzyme